MASDKEDNVAFFEQLRIFEPEKFFKRLGELNRNGKFIFEVLYGSAGLSERDESGCEISSRANYALVFGGGERAMRIGTANFETGISCTGRRNLYEKMVLVTEEQINIHDAGYIPRTTIKIKLVQGSDSEKIKSVRYDRKRYIWKMGWERTDIVRPVLPTECFVADKYIGKIEEIFNGHGK